MPCVGPIEQAQNQTNNYKVSPRLVTAGLGFAIQTILL